MWNARVLLGGIMLMALLACTMLTGSGPTTAEENQRATVANHWRHHDGHWNYWHEGDQRWYYTDGSNWFYNDGDDGAAWIVYGFDKGFGKEGFERGDYKVPEKGAKIETPRHGTYRAPAK